MDDYRKVCLDPHDLEAALQFWAHHQNPDVVIEKSSGESTCFYVQKLEPSPDLPIGGIMTETSFTKSPWTERMVTTGNYFDFKETVDDVHENIVAISSPYTLGPKYIYR
jgi:hypothetical protein